MFHAILLLIFFCFLFLSFWFFIQFRQLPLALLWYFSDATTSDSIVIEEDDNNDDDGEEGDDIGDTFKAAEIEKTHPSVAPR